MKVLFVCLGNICRSPAAEGILKAKILADGLGDVIQVDSAGTAAYHIGKPADSRMIGHAQARGFDLTSRARQFQAPADFVNNDLIFTMDETNYINVSALDVGGEFKQKVVPISKFFKDSNLKAVPDPYYEGEQGFHLVLDILEEACDGILSQIKSKLEATKLSLPQG